METAKWRLRAERKEDGLAARGVGDAVAMAARSATRRGGPRLAIERKKIFLLNL